MGTIPEDHHWQGENPSTGKKAKDHLRQSIHERNGTIPAHVYNDGSRGIHVKTDRKIPNGGVGMENCHITAKWLWRERCVSPVDDSNPQPQVEALDGTKRKAEEPTIAYMVVENWLSQGGSNGRRRGGNWWTQLQSVTRKYRSPSRDRPWVGDSLEIWVCHKDQAPHQAQLLTSGKRPGYQHKRQHQLNPLAGNVRHMKTFRTYALPQTNLHHEQQWCEGGLPDWKLEAHLIRIFKQLRDCTPGGLLQRSWDQPVVEIQLEISTRAHQLGYVHPHKPREHPRIEGKLEGLDWEPKGHRLSPEC